MPGSFYLNTPENSPGIMAGADPAWQLKQQAVEQSDAFKGGVPTDAAGNLDYGAMARTMFQRGGLEPGIKLLEAGVAQKQLADAGKLSEGMSKWLVPGGGADAQPAAAPSTTVPASGGYMPLFRAAISNNESSGKYDALGPVTKSGDRAFGKYGIMGSNVGPWTKQYTGTEMTPDQFLASPQAQDAVFNGEFGRLLKVHGNPQDAASVWFTGRPYAQGSELKDQLGTTGAGYVDKFMTSLRSGDAARLARAGQSDASSPTLAQAQPGAPSSESRPIQLAQNGDSDAPAPSSRNPYAASSASFTGPAGAPAARSYAPAGPQQPAAALTPPTMVPAPVPVSFGPPPKLSPNAGGVTAADDPTYGGQVPEAWLKLGHSAADWVRYQRTMAAIGSGNVYAKGAAEQWSKSADGLQTSIEKRNELTTEQKNARDPGAIAYEHQRDDYKYQSREQAKYLPSVVSARSADAASTAEAKQSGEALGKIPAQLAADADGARTQNATIDEMIDASRQFQMGKFADKEQAFNSTISALGHKLNVDTSAIDGKVAGYEAYAKLAGQFSRQAMKETGGRAGGIQELRFITNTLPSPTMSQAGFEAVANQLKGLNDAKAAKQQAGAAWQQKNGTMQGFDADWNKNVTPSAFVMHRLQVDQPEVFAQTVTRLAQSAQGRSVLKSMRTGMSYAGSNGLFD